MKFANKVSLCMTIVVTIAFSLFGNLILQSHFQRVILREQQAVLEKSVSFHVLFQMAMGRNINSAEEYNRFMTMKSVRNSVETGECYSFILSQDEELLSGEYLETEPAVKALCLDVINEKSSLGQWDDNSEVVSSVVFTGDEKPYLLAIGKTNVSGTVYFLGLCKDLKDVYQDRTEMVKLYRLTLVSVVFVCAIVIFLLSVFLTQPIRQLYFVTTKIMNGNMDVRASVRGTDEIGVLANRFNQMADRLSEHMKQLKEEADKKALEAQEKEDFIIALAHELRTPLTSIIGYAQMLHTMELSLDEHRDASYYIYSQGRRLEALTKKLFSLVQMEKQEIEKKYFSVEKLSDILYLAMKQKCMKKNVSIYISMERYEIYGDFDLLESLLINLCDNAVKAMMAKQKREIHVSGVEVPNGYLMQVQDTGCGIPREEVARVIEPFYMVDKSRARKEGGAGFGLALCQKIVLLHEGTMNIESELGKGTIISIFLRGGKRDEKE